MVAVKAENVWAGRKSTEKATSEEIKWRDALIEELEYHNISIRHPVYIDEAMVRAERLLNGTTLIPTKYLSDDVKKEFIKAYEGLFKTADMNLEQIKAARIALKTKPGNSIKTIARDGNTSPEEVESTLVKHFDFVIENGKVFYKESEKELDRKLMELID